MSEADDEIIQARIDGLNARIAALEKERDELRAEYESRQTWIEKMCAALGYNNADGMHPSPDPFEIVKELREKLAYRDAEIERLTNYNRDIAEECGMLDAQMKELRVKLASLTRIHEQQFAETQQLAARMSVTEVWVKDAEGLTRNLTAWRELEQKLADRDAEVERLKAWITDNTGFQDWGSLISTKESAK